MRSATAELVSSAAMAVAVTACGPTEPRTPPARSPAAPIAPHTVAATAGAPTANLPPTVAPTPPPAPEPGPIVALTTWCAAYVDGSLRCWRPAPNVSMLTDVRALAHDSRQVWAIDRDGRVHCDGCTEEQLTAVRSIEPLQTITVNGWSALVTDPDGNVQHVYRGKVERPAVPPNPLQLEALSDSAFCARYADPLLCWGYSSYGQHGQGSKDRVEPADDNVLMRGSRGVARGDYHACAIRANGRVFCWGEQPFDDHGVFGRPGRGHARSEVPSVHDAVAIAGSDTSTCVLTKESRVVCWGQSAAFDFATAVNGPFDLQIDDAEHIAMDDDMLCVAHRDGSVSCFGNVKRDQPIATVMLPGPAVALAAGHDYSCAIIGGGDLHCWGQLASGITRTPERLFDIDDAVAVSLGQTEGRSFDGCVARRDHDTACWSRGVLTDVGAPGAVDLNALHHHACALTAAGEVLCWGADDKNQLAGLGPSKHAIAIPSLPPSKQVGVTFDSTCVVDQGGAMRCWGGNEYGTFARGDDVGSATPVASRLRDVEQLALSFTHGCARRSGGKVSCWGSNTSKQVIFSQTSDIPRPIQRPDVTAASHISVGDGVSCALTEASELRCWGGPSWSLRPVLTGPATTVSMPGVVDVAFGKRHACVRREDGSVACWGDDQVGQLGRGGGDFGRVRVLTATSGSRGNTDATTMP